MKPLAQLMAFVFLDMAAATLLLSGQTSADCSADTTAGYVAFWRAWESDWCGAGVEDAVHSAFTYFDIFDQPGELAWHLERQLTDHPEIRLGDLKQEISGKRIALVSTHGGEDQSGGFVVECYATRDARNTAHANGLLRSLVYDRVGMTEEANGGTLFLSEESSFYQLCRSLPSR